jgi:hypothetical protein
MQKKGKFSVMGIAQNIISLRSVGNCFAISSSATFESFYFRAKKYLLVSNLGSLTGYSIRLWSGPTNRGSNPSGYKF